MCNHYSVSDIVTKWVMAHPPLNADGDVDSVPFEKWPKYDGHVVLMDGGRRVRSVGRWGVRGTDDKGRTTFVTNARNDTMLRGQSMWKESLATRRCLVPASSYFEPGTGPAGARGELRFTIQGRPWFLLAGVWEPDRVENGRLSFAIVTTEPNRYAARFHDRMPVVLSDEGAMQWLGQEPLPRETIKTLLHACPDEWMEHVAIPAVPKERKLKPATAPSAPLGPTQGELF
jgi:hypothetical protein